MQKTANLGNRRGFSTMMLLLLGMIFFSITTGIIAYMQSENNQMVDKANSYTQENRLSFIAYTMQADFFNNFLQTNYEDIIIKFLMEGTHTLDPGGNFDQNLGNELEDRLSQESQGIVSGDAAKVYAAAYTRRSIHCEPLEQSGSIAPVSIKEAPDGMLEVSGLSIGQSISCTDAEAQRSARIDLQARDYRLTTRIVGIYNKAIDTIKGIKKELDETTAIYELGANDWRLSDDDSVKSQLLSGPSGWNAKTRQMVTPFSLSDLSGISLEPMSLDVRDSDYSQFKEDDLDFSCSGGLEDVDSAWNPQAPQTCRPDNLDISIQEKELEDMENVLKLEFREKTGNLGSSNNKIDVFLMEGPLRADISQSEVSALILKILNGNLPQKATAYVDYSGDITRLCRKFEGRARGATVSGRVVETNPEYLTGDYGRITFDFKSTPLSLDTSDVSSDDVDCDSDELDSVVRENVKHLLTNGGHVQTNIVIEDSSGNGPAITQKSMDSLQTTINENQMVTLGGENKAISLIGTVALSGNPITTIPSSPTLGLSKQKAAEVGAITTPSAAGEYKKDSSLLNGFDDFLQTKPPQDSIFDLKRISDSAASTLSKMGVDSDAEAISDSSTALCKLIGLRNHMDVGNERMAIMALCGMGQIKDIEGAGTICDMASLYQAIESGELEAAVSGLSRMLKSAGYGDVTLDVERIREALKTGDAEQVLMAASAGALLPPGAADFLARATDLAYGLKTKHPLAAARELFSLIGETDMSAFFGAVGDIESAVEARDFGGSIRGLSSLAHNLGYKGLADLTGRISTGYNVYNMVANLDELKAKCEGAPWDLICAAPAVGGGVCGTPPPQFSECTFDYGAPTFDINLLCNDLVFDLGFQVDCMCVYTCPKPPEVEMWPRSVGINLKQIEMFLDTTEFKDLAARYDIESLLHSQELMQYCRMDP